MTPDKKDLALHRDERATSDHAQQNDLGACHARTTAPVLKDRLRAVVVGAGLSGLTAGRILADHGLDVQVVEKSRGTGGRLATRRVGNQAFDMGAQYFTARDDRFCATVDAWQSKGLVRQWQGRITALNRSDDCEANRPIRRFVGVPGMTAVSRDLATGLSIAFETRITQVEHQDAVWQLTTETGDTLGPYDVVMIATPATQAVPLLAEAPHLAAQAAACSMHPCWVAMATFDRPLPLAFDGVFLNSPILDWAARNSSKPGRPPGESWVIHATAQWSGTHVEEDADTVGKDILEQFFAATGIKSLYPDHLQAHRWRYAKTQSPLDVGCLWDPAWRIGACGDWCHGSRVEDAVLSGLAMARRVLRMQDSSG